jgi:predicted metal-dependent phosphoesterase TrpH
LIDLHTHTTASDGRCSPVELVGRAARAGISVLSVTDHDTTAACREAERACADVGIVFVPGIEITAVLAHADVHVLGYFIQPEAPALQAFLTDQRARRIERVHQMIVRLAELGVTLDADAIVRPSEATAGKTVGRPAIADALIASGHVATRSEAFERWLARGRPAFVPRSGAAPAEVIAQIHGAGGVASVAHPALIGHDEWIPGFVTEGLDAIEVYHSKHNRTATARYLAMANDLTVAVSGGSDYHADDGHGGHLLGSITLPPEAFDALAAARGRITR